MSYSFKDTFVIIKCEINASLFRFMSIYHADCYFTLSRNSPDSSVSTTFSIVIKDEVLLTVGCPIFPSFYIDSQISVHRKFKKNRPIDI